VYDFRSTVHDQLSSVFVQPSPDVARVKKVHESFILLVVIESLIRLFFFARHFLTSFPACGFQPNYSEWRFAPPLHFRLDNGVVQESFWGADVSFLPRFLQCI